MSHKNSVTLRCPGWVTLDRVAGDAAKPESWAGILQEGDSSHV